MTRLCVDDANQEWGQERLPYHVVPKGETTLQRVVLKEASLAAIFLAPAADLKPSIPARGLERRPPLTVSKAVVESNTKLRPGSVILSNSGGPQKGRESGAGQRRDNPRLCESSASRDDGRDSES